MANSSSRNNSIIIVGVVLFIFVVFAVLNMWLFNQVKSDKEGEPPSKEIIIDHKNENGLDNRKINLLTIKSKSNKWYSTVLMNVMKIWFWQNPLF